MDAIMEILSRGAEQLFGRSLGPLNFRLVVMPTIVTIIAIRAGLKDAREGQPVFLWEIFTNPSERRRLLRSGWKDVGRIIIVALVLDTVYQLIALRAFYVVQALIVALLCAVVPYVFFRGPTTRLARRFYRKQARATDTSSVGPTKEDESCQTHNPR
jgi:hypothetical protein